MKNQSNKSTDDIRERFNRMDPIVVLTKEAFAGLLDISVTALGQ